MRRAGARALPRAWHSAPNKGVELTGNSVRSCVAPAAPSSSRLAFGAETELCASQGQTARQQPPRQGTPMITERTHYFAQAGQAEAVLATRRKACDIRLAIGLAAGTVHVKADPSADGPDVSWSCRFADKAAHAADL